MDNNNNFTFTMPDHDVSVSVSFHKHAWTLSESVKPTVTSNGYDVYICSCGEVKHETSTFAAGDHNMILVPKMAATCTTNGIALTCYRCVDCFDYFKDSLGKTQLDLDSVILPIDKNNHTEVIDAGTPATCTAAGISDGKHCSECGAVIKAQTAISKLGHKYEDKVTKATASSDGKVVTKCAVCGNIKSTKTINKLGTVSLGTTKYTYDGKAKTPAVTVKDSKGNVIDAKNYTVSYSANTNVGTAAATIKFKGNYSGTKTLNFIIAPKQVTGLKASTVNTTSIKLTWTKVTGAKYYKVEQSTDGKKWTVVNAAATTNSITVSKLKAGTKYQFRVTALDSTKKIAGKASAVLKTGTLTAAPTVTLKSSKSKTAVASWKKVTGATKYIIYKSTDNKKWTKAGETTKLTYTLTKLTGGKKIYVKVTALNAYGNASAYSSVKNVTVKK